MGGVNLHVDYNKTYILYFILKTVMGKLNEKYDSHFTYHRTSQNNYG